MLDSLCETCLLAKPHTGGTRETGQSSASYVDYLSRDLISLVDCVVPPGQQGMPNFMSAVQVRIHISRAIPIVALVPSP